MMPRLVPIDRETQPDLPETPPRMLSICWAEEVETKVPRGKTGRLTVVRRQEWQARAFIFRALRQDGEDGPPRTKEELRYMVLQAYALGASHYPIPADATVYYEVGAP